MHDPRTEETIDLLLPDPPSQPPSSAVESAQVRIDVAALSDQGLVRANNEDHYLVVRFGRLMETLLSNLPAGLVPGRSDQQGYAILVADGIGGARAGEIASQLAISTLVQLVLRTPDWILSSGEHETEQVMERMNERYKETDAVLRREASNDPRLAGMGTTMTLASSFADSLIIGHIGDSRAYLFRGGQLHQLTRDHTLVQSLASYGLLTPEQAARHPRRHVLTRALGGKEFSLEAEFQHLSLCDEDQLLLCTDGLTEMVEHANIVAILRSATSANQACEKLVQRALENGGKDNVTVAVARYGFPTS